MKISKSVLFLLVSMAAATTFSALATTPDCNLVSAGTGRYFVMFGLPKKLERFSDYKHSEHVSIEEARQEIRSLVANGQCQINLETLPECYMIDESSESPYAPYSILQIARHDLTELRFRIPILEGPLKKEIDLPTEMSKAFIDATTSDVPLCKPAAILPKCWIEPQTSALFELFPDGTRFPMRSSFNREHAEYLQQKFASEKQFCE